jgi:hypothetical protein
MTTKFRVLLVVVCFVSATRAWAYDACYGEPVSMPQATAQSVSCLPGLLSELRTLGYACDRHSFSWWGYAGQSGQWTDQVRCQLPNQITVHVLQMGGEVYLQTNGVAGQKFSECGTAYDRTEYLGTCDEVVPRVEDLADLHAVPYPGIARKAFSRKDSVTVVASDNTCSAIRNDLNRLVTIYTKEGRAGSKLVCIPSATIQKKDPLQVKKYIDSKARITTNGILIIGLDIPAFELFARYPDGRFDTGATDLFYGTNGFTFDPYMLAKTNSAVSPSIYSSNNGTIYSTDYPSRMTLDVGALAKGIASGKNYKQAQWVARWAFQPTGGNLSQKIQRFISRRETYLPVANHNIFITEGSHDLFRPFIAMDFASEYNYFRHMMTNNSGYATDFRRAINADLVRTLTYLDRATTFLELNAHGVSTEIDDVSRYTLQRENIQWFPEIVNFDACWTGAWEYTYPQGPEDSLVSAAFETNTPPLAILGSQILSGTASHGPAGVYIGSGILYDWRKGQNLGARQISYINDNMSKWLASLSDSFFKTSLSVQYLIQILATHSVFGDGTVEY